jgi:hypothetical protein
LPLTVTSIRQLSPHLSQRIREEPLKLWLKKLQMIVMINTTVNVLIGFYRCGLNYIFLTGQSMTKFMKAKSEIDGTATVLLQCIQLNIIKVGINQITSFWRE